MHGFFKIIYKVNFALFPPNFRCQNNLLLSLQNAEELLLQIPFISVIREVDVIHVGQSSSALLCSFVKLHLMEIFVCK